MTTMIVGKPETKNAGGRYVCDEPRPGDAEALRQLQRMPMGGSIGLMLDVDHDHPATEAVDGLHRDLVVVRDRHDGQVVATGARSVKAVWVNCEPIKVGYLHGLRNAPGVRLPRGVIVAAYEWLLDRRQAGEAAYDFTSIMADNDRARRALERGVRELPTYTAAGEMVTLTFKTSRRRSLPHGVRDLDPSDADATAELLAIGGRAGQFRPVLDTAGVRVLMENGVRFVGVEGGGSLLACGAVWDQRPFKTITVGTLSPAMKRWRGMINLACHLTGRAALPGEGRRIEMVYGSFLAVDPEVANRSDAWRKLLAGLRVIAGNCDARAIAIGIPTGHALSRSRGVWRSRSVIYAVHRGAAPAIGNRVVWPEVAML